MRTYGQTVNDPTSNLARNVATATERMRENDQRIAELVARGMTREQAALVVYFGR